MAQELSEEQEIQNLIRQAQSARICITGEVADLKAKLDVPARLKNSLRIHPSGWLFGSLASGFIGSLLLRGRKSSSPKRARKKGGLLLSLLGLALTAIRPLAKVWLKDQVKNYLSGQPVRPLARRISAPRPILQPPI
jgi:hypothetical protein